MNFYAMRQLDYIPAAQARAVGKQFVQWLNMTGGTKLVLRLLQLEQEIRHLNDNYTAYCASLSDEIDGDEVSDGMSAKLDALMAKFNRLISRCQVYPSLIDAEFSGDYWTFRWNLVNAPRKGLNSRMHARPNETLDDLDALFCIVRLAQWAYLSRIKHCGCGKWFFERIWSQQFCSAKCRQWMFSKSEQFRAHRRVYMRKYYKLKVSGKVK